MQNKATRFLKIFVVEDDEEVVDVKQDQPGEEIHSGTFLNLYIIYLYAIRRK